MCDCDCNDCILPINFSREPMIIGGYDDTTFANASIGRSPFGTGLGYNQPQTGRMVVPINCTVSRLFVKVDTPPGVGQSVTVNLRVNGVASTLSAVVSGAVDILGYELTTIIPLNAGDDINFYLTGSIASVSVRTSWSAQLTP